MEPEIQEKIEGTVLQIPKDSNMDETTEYKIRKMASNKLGLDLSSPEYKWFVRQVLETFLTEQQSMAQQELDENKNAASDDDDEEDDEEQRKRKRGCTKEYDDEGDLDICKPSEKRTVTIQNFRAKNLVSIRDTTEENRDRKDLPTAKEKYKKETHMDSTKQASINGPRRKPFFCVNKLLLPVLRNCNPTGSRKEIS
ncbi:hypothetical protein U1Q18_037660 [Sarracenia purpurea var. burkii]